MRGHEHAGGEAGSHAVPDEGHSAVRNLMLDSDDVYAAMATFDSNWESGVPFTLVIAPDGKVIYRHQGAVDKLILRRKSLGSLPDAGMFAGNAEYWNQQFNIGNIERPVGYDQGITRFSCDAPVVCQARLARRNCQLVDLAELITDV